MKTNVKFFYQEHGRDFENMINDFINEKKEVNGFIIKRNIIDIKFSTTGDNYNSQIKYHCVVIYTTNEEDFK